MTDEHWARPVRRLHMPDELRGLNVEGRDLTGPLHGFGKLWEKRYRVVLGDVDPASAIATWKADYGSFWPPEQRFLGSLAGIAPGEIGVITGAHGPARMSTGVLVVYADETSFTFMTPRGHPWAGWITFSAFEEEGSTIAEVHLLVRTSDPFYEVGFALTGGARHEDEIWEHTLRSLAARLGVEGRVESTVLCLDDRRQWRYAVPNMMKNAMIRTMLDPVMRPFRRRR